MAKELQLRTGRAAHFVKAFVVALSLLFIIGLGGCTSESAKPKGPPKVIARLDGGTITKDVLDSALKVMLYQGVDEDGIPLGEAEITELKKSVLNEIIDEEIVLLEARKLELEVTLEELEGVVTSLKENYDNEAFLREIIPLYGSFERWREDVRRKLLVRKVIDGVKGAVEEVTDKEAKKYFKENSKDYNIAEQVHASMILVSSLEEGERVLQMLASGEEFAELAKEISLGPEAVRGGDLGFFTRSEMPEEFEEVVFKVPVGEPSDVISTQYGHHIFLVHARNKARKLKFSDVKEDIKEMLRDMKIDERLREWMLSLKKGIKIEVLEEI